MEYAASTWKDFKSKWAGPLNFRMEGECKLPEFSLPPLIRIIEELQLDPDTRIWSGAKGDSLDKTDIGETFRKLTPAEALASKFQASHFKLLNFYKSRKMLDQFEEKCLQPWFRMLSDMGFSWERYYPILFMSGKGCCTNFHVDPTNVMVWQIYGKKIWYTTQDPHRWAPRDMRMNWRNTKQPPGMTEGDLNIYPMGPRDMLWNAMLTPHWVDAANDEPALSINIAIDRLRLSGELCPHESELVEYMVSRNEDVVVAGKSPGEY